MKLWINLIWILIFGKGKNDWRTWRKHPDARGCCYLASHSAYRRMNLKTAQSHYSAQPKELLQYDCSCKYFMQLQMMNGNIFVNMDHVWRRRMVRMIKICFICVLICHIWFPCVHAFWTQQVFVGLLLPQFPVALFCLPLALRTKMKELMTMSDCDVGIFLLTSLTHHLRFISGQAIGWGPM